MRKTVAIAITALVCLVVLVWAGLEVRAMFKPPTQRLASHQVYPGMPEDGHHHYLDLPLDHQDPGAGTFRGFYILSPDFRSGGEVVFLLTDGQMDLVGLHPDFGFFDSLLGDLSYVLINPRGLPPTLFPEVYSPDGKLDHRAALRLYGSDQQVQDIEAVRLDMQRKGLLPTDGKIMLFGASGAGILAQQYLSRYGKNVRRAILAGTGAPDIARERGWSYSPDFDAFNPEGARLLDSLRRRRKLDLPFLANVLYQEGREHSDAREAQLRVLHDLDRGGSLARYWLKPQTNLSLLKLMMTTPASVAARVRWYELVGQDLQRYGDQGSRPLNLLCELSRAMLPDFLASADAGEIRVKAFQLDRQDFTGEVLVMSGTEDVVFSVEVGQALAEAYPNARWALFRDGHRLTAEPAYYRDLRRAFYLGGFGSEAFTSLYTAPLQLWRPVGNEPPRVFRRAR